MAADRKSKQGSKEEIAKGMAEAGKGEVGKAGGEAAKKGGRGHGADPGKISQGMSEAAGAGAGAKSSGGGAKSRRPEGVSVMRVATWRWPLAAALLSPRSGRA